MGCVGFFADCRPGDSERVEAGSSNGNPFSCETELTFRKRSLGKEVAFENMIGCSVECIYVLRLT